MYKYYSEGTKRFVDELIEMGIYDETIHDFSEAVSINFFRKVKVIHKLTKITYEIPLNVIYEENAINFKDEYIVKIPNFEIYDGNKEIEVKFTLDELSEIYESIKEENTNLSWKLEYILRNYEKTTVIENIYSDENKFHNFKDICYNIGDDISSLYIYINIYKKYTNYKRSFFEVKERITYENSKKNGLYKIFQNNIIICEGQFSNGKKSGVWKSLVNGELGVKLTDINHILNESTRSNDTTTQLNKIYTYYDDEGEINKIEMFSPDGQLLTKGYFKNNLKDGVWVGKTDNGNSVRTHYKNGVKHGSEYEIQDKENYIIRRYSNDILIEETEKYHFDVLHTKGTLKTWYDEKGEQLKSIDHQVRLSRVKKKQTEKPKFILKQKTYIFKHEKLYKIGKSVDPLKRLKSFKTTLPTIELIAVCEENIETKLHALYKCNRKHGEWFEISEDVVNNIIIQHNFNKQKFAS